MRTLEQAEVVVIVIIGKNGQLARSLLLAAGDLKMNVMAIGRPELDLENPGHIAAVIEHLNPGMVINAAAYTDVDGAEDNPQAAKVLNADVPGILAAITNSLGIPIVHFSTDYVFDGQNEKGYIESDTTEPLSVYGVTKLEGENSVARENPKHIIFRTSWLYSQFGKNFVKTMITLATERSEITVVNDQFGSPTFALDLARAVMKICEKLMNGTRHSPPVWGIYHLSGGGQTSWAALAEYIFMKSEQLGGPSASVNRIMSEQYPSRAIRPKYSIMISGKAARVFGVKLPDWKSSVERCVEAILSMENKERPA